MKFFASKFITKIWPSHTLSETEKLRVYQISLQKQINSSHTHTHTHTHTHMSALCLSSINFYF